MPRFWTRDIAGPSYDERQRLRILSTALTQYIENSQDMNDPPDLSEAQQMLDDINGEVQ